MGIWGLYLLDINVARIIPSVERATVELLSNAFFSVQISNQVLIAIETNIIVHMLRQSEND